MAGGWRLAVVARGARAGISPAGAVLAASCAGYGALAEESGLDMVTSILIGIFVWALPGQILLVSEMAMGTAMLAAAFGVSLTAVRLMPLVVTLMPVLGGNRLPRGWRLLAAHFCAVTTWVDAMRRLPTLPLAQRLPFYLGTTGFLTFTNSLSVAAGFVMASALGVLVSAALLFMTPLYFLLSMTSASPGWSGRLALGAGLVIGPLVFLVLPGFDLLLAGLVGGTGAYLVGRRLERKP